MELIEYGTLVLCSNGPRAFIPFSVHIIYINIIHNIVGKEVIAIRQNGNMWNDKSGHTSAERLICVAMRRANQINLYSVWYDSGWRQEARPQRLISCESELNFSSLIVRNRSLHIFIWNLVLSLSTCLSQRARFQRTKDTLSFDSERERHGHQNIHK